MTLRLFLLALTLFVSWAPASAHRLDEYLQATTFSVDRNDLTMRLRLTPGMSVAAAVLAQIDTNGDGAISSLERRRYAERQQARLRLMIDGVPADLRLLSWSLATPVALRNGVGDITLEFTAPITKAGSHRLVLDHLRADDQAVYLVNTLIPTDAGIQVVAQQRTYDQSRYQLDFNIAAGTAVALQAGSRDAEVKPAGQAAAPVLITFFWQGVRHILTGYDHLLFVAALVLGATTLWDLVKVVTAFTVAHSITLTLAALGLVNLSEMLVEPVIAASIVAVAVQNVVRPEQARGRSRLALAFLFGLFHGLGFAGGLLEVMHGMSWQIVLRAILGFSLGVETGNQMLLLPLFAALRVGAGRADDLSKRGSHIRRYGSMAVAGAGMFYLTSAIAAA